VIKEDLRTLTSIGEKEGRGGVIFGGRAKQGLLPVCRLRPGDPGWEKVTQVGGGKRVLKGTDLGGALW